MRYVRRTMLFLVTLMLGGATIASTRSVPAAPLCFFFLALPFALFKLRRSKLYHHVHTGNFLQTTGLVLVFVAVCVVIAELSYVYTKHCPQKLNALCDHRDLKETNPTLEASDKGLYDSWVKYMGGARGPDPRCPATVSSGVDADDYACSRDTTGGNAGEECTHDDNCKDGTCELTNQLCLESYMPYTETVEGILMAEVGCGRGEYDPYAKNDVARCESAAFVIYASPLAAAAAMFMFGVLAWLLGKSMLTASGFSAEHRRRVGVSHRAKTLMYV